MKLLGFLLPFLIGLLAGFAMFFPVYIGVSAWWLFLSIPLGLMIGIYVFLYFMDRFVWEPRCWKKEKNPEVNQ